MTDDSGNLPAERQVLPEEWVTMPEAARRLGVSERTIRLRAQQGRIERKRDGQRVLVKVAALPEDTGKTPADSGSLPEALEVDREAHLLEEIAYLRAELTAQREARDREGAELRRLMAIDKEELVQLRRRLAIAPPPQDAASSRQDDRTGEEGQGAVKSWWSRLFRRG